MRASGRLLRRLALPGVCAACEGWTSAEVSALLAGEVGACVWCRLFSASNGRPAWCGPHMTLAWRLYRARERHGLDAHGALALTAAERASPRTGVSP